jgi:putative DNA methylase
MTRQKLWGIHMLAEIAHVNNELNGSWHAIVAASHGTGHSGEQQGLDF